MDRHDSRVGVRFEPRDEVAAVAANAVEELIAIVAKIEEEEPVLGPLADAKDLAVALSLGGDLHALGTVAVDRHDDVELQGGIGVVGAATRERLRVA